MQCFVSFVWEKASERMKCHYLRKAEQSVSAVLDVIAPGLQVNCWQNYAVAICFLLVRKPTNRFSKKEKKELEVFEALAASYLNAQH